MRWCVVCLLVLALSPPVLAAPVAITTATDLQAAITANIPGTVFVLEAGTHRRGNLVPKNGNVFLGAPGAILSGGVILTGWTASGSNWYVAGQTQGSLIASSSCQVGFEACRNHEDVFYDDVPLVGVTTLGALGPGKFFFDYAADRIYIRDTPSGHVVETSVLAAAFTGAAVNVTVRNLQIEKYATAIQDGAFEVSTAAHGWTIEGCVIRHNHGYGIHVTGSRWTIRGNTISVNGQLGMGGAFTKNLLVEGNIIAGNNYARVSPGFESGGAKMTNARGLRYVRNVVTGNDGKGLWCDISCVDVLYDSNVVMDNTSAGISHEISYRAVVKHNTSLGNGTVSGGWMSGAQIGAANSERMDIYGNVVRVAPDPLHGSGITIYHQNRGSGIWGVHKTRLVQVQHNTIRYAPGTAFTDGFSGNGDDYLFDITEMSNVWDYNIAFVAATAPVWAWKNCLTAGSSYASFIACGPDAHGARYDP